MKSKHKSCENPLVPPPLSSTPRRSERICSTNSSVLGSGYTLNQVSSAEVQTAAMTVNVVRIPCLLCGKSYQTQRWLDKHMLTHDTGSITHGTASITLPLPTPNTTTTSQLPTANLSLASVPQPGMIPRQQCPECSWTGATAAAVKTHKTKKTLYSVTICVILFCSVSSSNSTAHIFITFLRPYQE